MKKFKSTNKALQQLAKKVVRGKATEDEKHFLEEYYNFFDHPDNHLPGLTQPEKEVLSNEIKNRLLLTTSQQTSTSRIIRFPVIRVAAAVALLIVATVCVYQYLRYNKQVDSQVAKIKPKGNQKPISYGGNKATLTLANGNTIDLNDEGTGILAKQAGVKVTKTAEGKLTYSNSADANLNTASELNVLQTPKGGTYQISLPDGTQVWLNSASVLKYPVAFKGTERKVELSGEAYFEVAHNKHMPFRVVSNNQVIEVLGTHFNINSYADEASSLTTLLEGSVRVRNLTSNSIKLLIPGEQASVASFQINVKKVDTDKAIAWKNGLFQFDNDDIHIIMRKLARWYDVDVEYRDELKGVRFGGTVSRYTDISEVLRKLELTNTIHFKIMERRIVVMK